MKARVIFKLLTLIAISVVLLLVLASINGLTNERENRLHEVEQDIAGSYAEAQTVGGPIFEITYREYWTERNSGRDQENSALQTQLIYPETLTYDGTLSVQERYRGIFKANVYQSKGTLRGRVEFPTLDELDNEADLRIEVVSVNACFLISDSRGLPSVPALKWENQELEFKAGSALAYSKNGIHAELPDAANLFGNSVEFSTTLNLNGTRQLQFIPLAEENHFSLKSSWKHPSFFGDFLAENPTVSDDGFSADWHVNALACSAQQSINSGMHVDVQHFGVSLIDPISPHSLTDRALKYGFLFIFITFAAFFLFEMLQDLRIHPVQYGFVGLAQSIFFLLLLSLSEHVGFGISYALAGLSTIGLITYYLCHVMQSYKRGLSFGAFLALLYGVLFGLLQSEDHALVAGSILLFGLMTLVMFMTRKVDWYALTTKPGRMPETRFCEEPK